MKQLRKLGIGMDCKEARSLVMAFIKDEIPEDKLEPFLKHISGCKDCYEELEIYYTVHVGIQGLDQDQFTTYDLSGALRTDLEEAREQVRSRHVFTVFRIAVGAAAVLLTLLAAFFQFQRWL